MNKNIQKLALIICVFLLLAIITGCSSNSGNETTTATLKGTIATGAGTLYVADANGSTSNIVVNQDSSGQYSVNVEGMAAPFILGFDHNPEDGVNDLYSFAESVNMNANLSQLTTLTLFIANNESSLAELFENWNSSQLSATKVTEARSKVTANLAPQIDAIDGLDASTYNFMTTLFSPNGEGIDGLLDNITVDFSDPSNFNVSLKGNNDFSFNIDIDPSANETSDNNETPAIVLSGKWCLQISAFTLNGIVSMPPSIVQTCNIDGSDVPTEKDFSAFEQFVGQEEARVRLSSSSATEVVMTISYSVQGNNFELAYTYTKQ